MFEIFDYLSQPSSQEKDIVFQQERIRQKEEEEEKEREEIKRKQKELFNSLQLREKDLRELPDVKIREKENYKDFVKSHYGFTPDNKKKKVLAGILEGVGGIASSVIPGFGLTGYGRGRMQSRQRAETDYENEYRKLLGIERLEAQQYKDAGKMYQDSINTGSKEKLAQQKNELTRQLTLEQNKTKNRALDITQELGKQSNQIKAFTAQYDAMEKQAKSGNLEAKTKLDEFNLAIGQKLGIDPKMINPSNRSMIFNKLFQDDLEGIINTESKLNKSKEKPKDPIIKFIEEHGIGPDGNPTVKFKPQRFDRSTGAQLGGGGQTSAIPPNANPAQQIAGNIRQKPLGSEPVTPDGKYFPKGISLAQKREIINNTPLGNLSFGEGPTSKKLQDDYLKNREVWKGLTQRTVMTSQGIFDGIATGKIKEWQSAFLQNPIVKKFRDAFGGTTSVESIVGQNEVLALMEHMRARYGSRPAHALLKEVGDTLRSGWENPETFARKAGSISLMIQVAQKGAEDPRFGEYLDDAFDTVAKNPNKQKSLMQAFDEEIEDSLTKSKQGMRNRYPTLEGMMKRLEEPLIDPNDEKAIRKALGLK